MSLVQVKNLNSLYALQNHEKGEIAFISDIEKYYIYNGENWVELQYDHNNQIGLSLYEVNKQIIAQMPSLSEEELEKTKELFSEYVNSEGHTDSYYMLLCHDLRYYTLFARDQKYKEDIADAIIDCISYIGDIKSIDYSENGQAIEIWVVSDEEAYVMYFFNYGEGVVLCK